MWKKILGNPKEFTRLIRNTGKNQTEQQKLGYKINITSMLPIWLDEREIALPYQDHEPLLICFSDSVPPYVDEAPIVFEVMVRGGQMFEQHTVTYGIVNQVFSISNIWYSDGAVWRDTNSTKRGWQRQPVDISDSNWISNISDNLTSLLSQRSKIWGLIPPDRYVPLNWVDIASFVARESVLKYGGVEAMEHKIYMHVFSLNDGMNWWQAINKKRVE